MIVRALVLYVLLVAGTLFWCRVEAAAVPLNVGAGVARSAASTTSYVTTAEAAWSGAAFNSGMTTSIGGRAVTVPATWRFASNAGQFAMTALRTNPWGAAAAAAVSVLLPYGIQKCVNGDFGNWCIPAKQEQAPNGTPYPKSSGWYSSGYTAGAYSTPDAACKGDVAYWNGQQPTRGWSYVSWTPVNGTSSNFTQFRCAIQDNAGFVWDGPVGNAHRNSCATGATEKDGYCIPAGYVAPGTERAATDADWSKVPPNTLTASDVLLNALGRDGAFIDIKPEFATSPQVVPLSDPYIDPVTGKRFRDIATVQPNPDGKTAEVQTAKQEVDSQGNPAKDASGAEAAPQKQDDPCVGHETRLGCMTAGDVPEGPDLTKDERRITITPDNGWGPDTLACPADIVMPLHGGAGVVSYSFKAQCDFADGVRAPVIAMAWVAAVLIALGVGSKGGE